MIQCSHRFRASGIKALLGALQTTLLSCLPVRLLYHNFIVLCTMNGAAAGAIAQNYDTMFSPFPRKRDKSALGALQTTLLSCLPVRLLYHNFIVLCTMNGAAAGAIAQNYDTMFSPFPRKRDKSALGALQTTLLSCLPVRLLYHNFSKKQPFLPTFFENIQNISGFIHFYNSFPKPKQSGGKAQPLFLRFGWFCIYETISLRPRRYSPPAYWSLRR